MWNVTGTNLVLTVRVSYVERYSINKMSLKIMPAVYSNLW